MYPKKVARETAGVLQSYLTYQAVRTIIDQLSETNPQQAIWLRQFSAGNNVRDGERYLQQMMSENKEMVLRILTVREHLAEAVLDFLPEMVRAGIQKDNIDCRRQILERLTRTEGDASPASSQPHPEVDSNESPES